MKQFYLALAALAAAPVWAATPPYYSDMGSAPAAAIDPEWTIINENSASNTWVYDNTNDNLTKVTGAPCGIKYNYDSKNDADDWAISPAVGLLPGVEYKISFWLKTSSSTEDLTLYISTSDNPEQIRTSQVIHDFVAFKDSSWKKYIYTFTVGEAGEYHAAFFLHSPRNHYNVFLRGFTLSENVSVPECVTALTATPADDRMLSVDLQWTLPSLDTDGNPLAEPIESVMLSRDGAEIATLPGSDESYTDTEATGLDSGFHTYQVRVVCGGQTSRPAEVATSYVGPVKPMELPFADDMENELMWSLWTVLDPDGDAASGNPSAYIWSRWANTALTGNQLVYSNTGASNAENDWAFTPALAFNARGTYILTFDACMYNAYASTCNLDIYLTPDAETASKDAEPIASFQTFQSATYPKDGEKVEITFSISEPGAYRIAFHEHAEAARRQVRLDNFSVTVGELAPPLIPADFTLSAENTGGAVILQWVNPATDTSGNDLAAITSVKIMRGTTEIDRAETTPGQPQSYTDTSAPQGAHTYTVVVDAADGSAQAQARAWAGACEGTVPYSVAAGDDELLAWRQADGTISMPFAMGVGYYSMVAEPAVSVTVNGVEVADGFFADRLTTDALRQIAVATTRDELQHFAIDFVDLTPAPVAGLAVSNNDDYMEIIWTYPDASADGVAEHFEILAADIYRDDDKIATLTDAIPGASATYRDAALTDGKHTYGIELRNLSGTGSRAECSIEISGTGVTAADGITFDNATIRLHRAGAITVADIAGRIVAAAFADSLSLKDLPKGMYIVHADGKALKINL